jgi:hypothetical protein
MDAPPPYYSGQKKSNVGLIIAIILGVVCVCCILPILAVGGLGFWGFSKMKGMMGCSIAFTTLQRSIQDYADAHDGKLPKADTWQTDIHPYLEKEASKNEKELKMFTNGPLDAVGCTNGDSPSTGIAFNTELSGKKISDVKDPLNTVMLFEVPKTGSNLSEPYKAQPYASSPTMLGKNRGWYVCGIDGRVEVVGRNGIRTNGDIAPKTDN